MKFIKTLRDGRESEMIAPASMKDQLLRDDRIRLAEEQEPEKDDLIEEAFALKVPGPDGKPAFKATIERWSVKRLQEAIATAKKAEA